MMIFACGSSRRKARRLSVPLLPSTARRSACRTTPISSDVHLLPFVPREKNYESHRTMFGIRGEYGRRVQLYWKIRL